ncbi:cystathionine beta-lyase [Phyllobacterium trifolii]|uniref:Cystathionine beta-lyase n=1 Tax=Phyllobacterium trifolii TaxID=300193 RepID=A0A839UIU2_9HYPH|nr:PLP-dependent transferase [Phyllobacterium trifolii]MBB3149694.1 cystathionine beta-lyase [Phyllobacterium trifolii]
MLELVARIAELEGAYRTFVVPGGQAAIALIYLALCKSGSHALVPASAYGPNRELAEKLLQRLGIEVEPYDPLIGEGIGALIRHNTALMWTESPGSITMEVQDVPSIVRVAHARGVPVALDNTYAAGVLFDAFAHGVDISMQALTKYAGGHSDLLLGTVSVKNDAFYEPVGTAWDLLGMAVSPDDASLALRGLQTLRVRLERLERSTLQVANWLAGQSAIQNVLHPALPSSPGHVFWKRDFTGSASVLSIVFKDVFTPTDVDDFVDRLALFKAGYSWGGGTSLAMTYPYLANGGKGFSGRIVRLNIGLEEPDDLIADLHQSLRIVGDQIKK